MQTAIIQMLSKILNMPVNITPPFLEKQRQQRSGHCGQTPEQHMVIIIVINTNSQVYNFSSGHLFEMFTFDFCQIIETRFAIYFFWKIELLLMNCIYF